MRTYGSTRTHLHMEHRNIERCGSATSDQERAEWDVPPLAEQLLKAEQATRSHPPAPVGEDAPQWLKDALHRWENGRTNMHVTIIGAASTARQCLKAGVADELHIDIMPVLLGSGLRLFEDMEMDSIRLERIKVVELPGGRTNLQFRIVK